MRHSLSLLLLFIFASACNKATDGTTTPTANFNITGLRDVDLSLTSSGSYTFPIAVTATTTTQDTVTLYANQLPGGVYVSFSPMIGITPFSSNVTVSSLGTDAKTYSIQINGAGRSGLKSYQLSVSTPPFRGWQLGTDMFTKAGVTRNTSAATITASAGGGAELVFTFSSAADMPAASRSYGIGAAAGSGRMAIGLHDGAHIWQSTGGGAATGSFTFDTQGKFNFKCANVEMGEGTVKKMLSSNFTE